MKKNYLKILIDLKKRITEDEDIRPKEKNGILSLLEKTIIVIKVQGMFDHQ